MNTEAIIEKLLQIRDEQILNTPLDDLDLSPRVYRSLWRSRVRTVREAAEIWNRNLKVWNIGERARREILGALQAWCLSLPNFTEPATAKDQAEAQPPDGDLDLRSPIETLHLSQRTYRLLKRNQIDTLDDIYREWAKIASTRNVGRGTMEEISKALDALQSSESVRTLVIPNAIDRRTGLKIRLTGKPTPLAVDRKDPNPESHPATDDLADRSSADAIGYENIHEVPTKKYVITDSGFIVNADLLQAEEPRKPREERWKNVSRAPVSAKPEDYAPENTFQAIRKGQDKISSPTGRWKMTPDDSERKYTNLLRVSLERLEKANRPRKVRNVTCPLCRAVMKSIQFEEHLVNMHAEAFQDLQSAVSGSLGWQNVPGVGLVFREPREANPFVKCPLCEYRDRYRVMNIHIQVSHPEVDPGLMIKRFHKVNRSKDYENLLRYKDELNELIREYERLKQGHAETRDGSQ